MQQRDAKSHRANYANRMNYACYSEVSPEISLASCNSALLTPETRRWGKPGARGAVPGSAAWRCPGAGVPSRLHPPLPPPSVS